MSVTILEALQNARHNLANYYPRLSYPLFRLARAQLNNAVTLLEKGYTLGDLVEPLLEEYGEVENVPDKVTSNYS